MQRRDVSRRAYARGAAIDARLYPVSRHVHEIGGGRQSRPVDGDDVFDADVASCAVE